jgi:hypothetical protein
VKKTSLKKEEELVTKLIRRDEIAEIQLEILS